MEQEWTPDITRLRYRLIMPDGGGFWSDKAHPRHGHYWIYPCHEGLSEYDRERHRPTYSFKVRHQPVKTPDHSGRLDLLRMGIHEYPEDPRPRFYLGRDLYLACQYQESRQEFHTYLTISRDCPYRACAMRYLAGIETLLAERMRWLYQAIGEDPTKREAYVELAMWLYDMGDLEGAVFMARRAKLITQPPLTYATDGRAWGNLPDRIEAEATRKQYAA